MQKSNTYAVFKKTKLVRSEIFRALLMKIPVFWDTMSCRYQAFWKSIFSNSKTRWKQHVSPILCTKGTSLHDVMYTSNAVRAALTFQGRVQFLSQSGYRLLCIILMNWPSRLEFWHWGNHFTYIYFFFEEYYGPKYKAQNLDGSCSPNSRAN
jgi:hypothetical protein